MKLREGKDLFQGLTASEWESQRSGNVANRESLRSPGLRLVFLTTVPYCLRWTFSGLCLIPALPPLLSKLSVMIIPNHLMLPPGKWILELLKNPTFFFSFLKKGEALSGERCSPSPQPSPPRYWPNLQMTLAPAGHLWPQLHQETPTENWSSEPISPRTMRQKNTSLF